MPKLENKWLSLIATWMLFLHIFNVLFQNDGFYSILFGRKNNLSQIMCIKIRFILTDWVNNIKFLLKNY